MANIFQKPLQNPDEDSTAKILKELDEIKRVVAATYHSVDNEIQEIKNHLSSIEREIRDNDRQLDRIETFERTLKSIEGSTRNLERRVK